MNVTRTISLAAAIGGVAGVYTESAAWARSFICVNSSATFQVQIGQDAPSSASTGVSFVIPEGAGHIVLLNTSAAAVNVTFVLSDAAYVTQPLPLSSQILVADTQTQTAGHDWTLNTFGAAATYSYPGTRNGRQRKYIYISNREPAGSTADLGVEDSAGNFLAVVLVTQSARLDLSDDLVLRNLKGGGGAKIYVFEVF